MIVAVAMYALLRPGGLQAGVWLGSNWPAAPLWHWEGSWTAVWAGSLPGGLWMLSATAIQAAIWADQPGRARRVWLLAPLAVGIGWELAQAAGVLSGTFDPLDLLAYVTTWGCLVAVSAQGARRR
jgi:hypothetical protein